MKYLSYILCVLSLLLCQCSQTTLAGGTSDTGNPRVTATILYANKAPVKGALVHIRPTKYLSPLPLSVSQFDSFTTITDDSGRFITDSLPRGDYRIEVTAGDSLAVLIDATIKPESPIFDAGSVTVVPYGTLTGKVDSIPLGTGTLFVQVYGLARVVPVKTDGTYSIEHLPAGSYTLRIASIDTLTFLPAEVGHVALYPQSKTIVNTLAPWRYSFLVTINTSITGANISENVTNFPLLVRLDTKNFDFNQSRDSGQDIRFTKNDGSIVPFEVDIWNKQLGIAALWILIDSIYGNNDRQSFIMHWGNSQARSLSNGKAVFDTGNGALGVWHLGDPGVSLRANSAQTAFAARPANYSGNESVDGIIGKCDNLDSLDHDTLGIINTGTITLSAWINPASFQPYARIIGRPDSGIAYHNYALNLDSATQLIEGAISTSQGGFSMQSIAIVPKSSWTHVCLTYDGAMRALYINGVPDNVQPATGQILSRMENAFLALNPTYPGYQKFVGKIDEARIESVARSAAWIKLSYENQKPGRNVIEFR